MTQVPPPSETSEHGVAVAVDGAGLLIRGRSGSGKSTLAMSLIGLGALLVADDRVALRRDGDQVLVIAPDTMAGLIEMRGVGILHAAATPKAPLALVVDMNEIETERLPPLRYVDILGCKLPCLHKVDSAAFPAAIRQYLLHGRSM